MPAACASAASPCLHDEVSRTRLTPARDYSAPDRPRDIEAFSEPDRGVRAWWKDQCRQAGLAARTDGIGNVIVRVDCPGGHACRAVGFG